ncbi:MAG: hypothetical protein KGI05_05795 [Thaumarchaeota archaeon]|nr:hypothetical protein [Nitrososphaerota archaeon]
MTTIPRELVIKKENRRRKGLIAFFILLSFLNGWFLYQRSLGLYPTIIVTAILIALIVVIGIEKEKDGRPKASGVWITLGAVVGLMFIILLGIFGLYIKGPLVITLAELTTAGIIALLKSLPPIKLKNDKEKDIDVKNPNQLKIVAQVLHTQEKYISNFSSSGDEMGGSTTIEHKPHRENIDKVLQEMIDAGIYIGAKTNGNVFVCGTSGQGKSIITIHLHEKFPNNPKLIFAYKPDDVYFRMGVPILDFTKYVPDIFSMDKEAVVRAFMTIIDIANKGITASQIKPLLRNALTESSNWDEVENHLKEKKKHGNDIQAIAIDSILEILPNLRLPAHPIRLELDKQIVIDMTRLANDEVRGFYTEILLYDIWSKLQHELEVSIDKRIIVCIDEVHRILKNQTESTIEKIARDMRRQGMLWLTTQNYADLDPNIKNQCMTQFVFNTAHEHDLEQLKRINDNLPFAVVSLRVGEFVDARQDNIHESIKILKILNLKPDNKPRIEYQPILVEQKKPIVVIPTTTGGSVVMQDHGETLRDRILQVLDKNEESMAISQVAKALYKNEITKDDKDKVKLAVNNEINKLVKEDILDKQTLIDEKDKVEKHVYRKNENLSKFHITIQNRSIKLLKKENITILGVAEHQGIQGEDITLDNYFIECETGLKESLGAFDKKVMGHSKPVIIVVPNKEQKERYSDLPSVQNRKAQVVLLSTLIRVVKEFVESKK